MPRTLPLTKVVTKAVACDHLGICTRTFDRVWAAVFTDPRDADERGRGVARPVFEDELRAAVEAGGRTGSRARAAVYGVRKLTGRV
jgi:hypothetical protein